MLKKTCLFSILISQFAFAGPTPNFCTPMPTGMVSWWTGDQNANDFVGSNHGTYTGAYLPGKIGSAFAISGQGNDFVTVPQSASLESATVTVDAWVQANGSPGNFKYLASKGGKGCEGGASYALYTGRDGGLAFYVYDGNSFIVSPAVPASTIWDNQWHLVAGTYDGSSVSLYLDGNLVGSSAASLTINYQLTNNQFAIGQYLDCPSQNLSFKGNIDEVEVFSRALSAAEIQSLYQADAAGKCNINIDVKHHHHDRCIHLKNKGNISVSILGSETFDVRKVDPRTLKFNGLSVRLKHNQEPSCTITQFEDDAYPNLICRFLNNRSVWNSQTSTVTMTGQLYDHTHLIGNTTLCLKDDDRNDNDDNDNHEPHDND